MTPNPIFSTSNDKINITSNGRECPNCGNKDFDDDFTIIHCSKCTFIYVANQAKAVVV